MAVETRAPDETESAENRKSKGLLSRVGPSIPYVLGGLLLVAYFVWLCMQMSSAAPSGGGIPLSIFGAVALGVLAGGASMISARRDKSKKD